MTRNHIKIKKSLDSILEIVDNLKKEIKDGDYKKIMDKLKIINDNNKEEKKFKQYKGIFMVVSIQEDITNHQTEEHCEEEVFSASYNYTPVIEVIRQKFRMSREDYNVIEQTLSNTYSGVRYIYGVCDCNPIKNFMDILDNCNDVQTTTKMNSDSVEIIKRLRKRVRLLSIEEI